MKTGLLIDDLIKTESWKCGLLDFFLLEFFDLVQIWSCLDSLILISVTLPE